MEESEMTTGVKKVHKSMTAALIVLVCIAVAAPSWAQQRMMTVPAGTRITVRLDDTLDANNSRAGGMFTGSLQTNVQVGGTVAAPSGTRVHGRVTTAQGAGRARGSPELALELTDIIIGGTAFPILTDQFSIRGSSTGASTARNTVRGAGLGTAIGAISGNAGRGAAIGATAGAAGSMATRGENVGVPRGTMLEFRLQQPASLPAR
jgi:hypothetical protein